jgi:putrescine transport system substrate-binding protein
VTALVAAVIALGANALEPSSPFAPPPKPASKIVRLLAPSGAFDAKTLGDFERETGYAVAYDAYGDATRILTMMKEGPYDVVVLPGPALARAIAAGQLSRIDKAQIRNARLVAPPVAAKLAAYDPSGAYGLAWGWSATGLLYDAGTASKLLGGPPNSWAVALAPDVARKLAPCGVALPDSRDELFAAAWRLLGVDPAKLRERDVKAAADLIIRASATARLPVSRDTIAAIAGGAVCLTFGDAAQARIASRRSREGAQGLDIRYAQPREGAPIAIDALAEPRDAPHPDEAPALIDFLLRPDVAAQATEAAGHASAELNVTAESLRYLWPVGAYDPRLSALIEKEWARVRAPEPPERKPPSKAASKSTTKPTIKPTRTKR